MPRLRCMLLGLVALLVAVHASQLEDPGKPECKVQAWVRAPDLAPNVVVQGNARVKVSAGCPAVESVSLGLRFKERSFVKTLRSREDVGQLNPERETFDAWKPSPWSLSPSRFVNESAQEAYEELIMNKDRWIVREEERLVFETTQPFDVGNGDWPIQGVLRDAVQDFAILVPSTNFPPALDPARDVIAQHMDVQEIGNVEWIYEYFAQISFLNGTMKETSAGLTAFRPLPAPIRAPNGPIVMAITFEASWSRGRDPAESPVTNYSVEISASADTMTLSTGKENHFTAVVTRTGFARTFSAPLDLVFCVKEDILENWVAEHGMPNESAHYFPSRSRSVLRVTSVGRDGPFGGRRHFCHWQDSKIPVTMANSTSEEIEAQEIVTTTSAPFTVSIDVEDTHVTDFEMYYLTLANSLTVRLTTPRVEDELVDPDYPLNAPTAMKANWGPQFEDDEEAWVPWEKPLLPLLTTWGSYMGRTPIVVHPASEITSTSQGCLHPNMDNYGQTILSGKRSQCERPSLTHYLDEGARAPVFVGRSIIQEVLAENPMERELRAPILEPVVSSPPEGEELVYRYYRNFRRPLIYVGETWAKKVVNKDKDVGTTNTSDAPTILDTRLLY